MKDLEKSFAGRREREDIVASQGLSRANVDRRPRISSRESWPEARLCTYLLLGACPSVIHASAVMDVLRVGDAVHPTGYR
jgi:hypothetical protein